MLFSVQSYCQMHQVDGASTEIYLHARASDFRKKKENGEGGKGGDNMVTG